MQIFSLNCTSLRTWNRNMLIVAWLYFYQSVYLSAGVVVSVAGVLMVITTAVIIVICIMMKRRQPLNIKSEWFSCAVAWMYVEHISINIFSGTACDCFHVSAHNWLL